MVSAPSTTRSLRCLPTSIPGASCPHCVTCTPNQCAATRAHHRLHAAESREDQKHIIAAKTILSSSEVSWLCSSEPIYFDPQADPGEGWTEVLSAKTKPPGIKRSAVPLAPHAAAITHDCSRPTYTTLNGLGQKALLGAMVEPGWSCPQRWQKPMSML